MALCTGDRHTALSACVRHAEDIIMQLIHQSLVYLHIITGIGALLLFWIPVIARKGSHQHKRVGRWFASLMYAVGISGVVLSSLDLLLPTHFHQDFPSDTAVRDRAMFLLSLSLLVLTSTRHGWLTINYKDDRTPLRQPLQLLLTTLLLVTGLVMLVRGLNGGSVIYIAFGILELALASGMLRYAFKKSTLPREWWTELLGGLIASGIGAYTAFFVVGAA